MMEILHRHYVVHCKWLDQGVNFFENFFRFFKEERPGTIGVDALPFQYLFHFQFWSKVCDCNGHVFLL